MPQTYRDSPPEVIQINTTNRLVIDAWSQQRVVTTDVQVDGVIAQLGTVTIEPRYAPDPAPGDPWYFEARETRVYSEERLNEALRPASTWLNAPHVAARDDGTWSWIPDSAATAQVDFTFGWGDCFVACTCFHTVRAIIPEVGDATVYDLGGDPLPDYLHLDPNTKPLSPP